MSKLAEIRKITNKIKFLRNWIDPTPQNKKQIKLLEDQLDQLLNRS
tara:strand:- start:48 stop:185 length:138 start_codon:yes stop_codon:yes gene_type:complete